MPSSPSFSAVPRAITTNALNALHYWPKRRPLQLLPYVISTFFFFYFAYQVAVFPFPRHLPRGAHSSGSAWLNDDHSRLERYSHKTAVSAAELEDFGVGVTGRVEEEGDTDEGQNGDNEEGAQEEWKPDDDAVGWDSEAVNESENGEEWKAEGEAVVHEENSNEEWKGEGETIVHEDNNEEWKPEGEAVVHEENNEEWKPEAEAVVHEENNEEWKPEGETVVHEESKEEWKDENESIVHEDNNEEWKPDDVESNSESTWIAPSFSSVEDRSSSGECLNLIVYDKPVKTGSTAVRDALLEYLTERNATWVDCTFDACLKQAEGMISGEVQARNLVEHMQGANGIIRRLGTKGFYKVTSVRDPRSRWESAYRYNKMLGARHYGIEPDVSYEEFMRRMPECSLYDFYDKLGGGCDMGGGWEKRLKEIVERYDEVIDLYDDSGENEGQLFGRLKKWVRISNKSPEYESDGEVDEGRWEKERRLYEALRERRKELIGREPKLC